MNLNGTVNDLTTNLRFNGVAITPVAFGVLAQVLGDAFATKVGSVKKEGVRGKPATIWELSANSPVAITEAILATTSDATAPEAENEAENATTDEPEGDANPDDVVL